MSEKSQPTMARYTLHAVRRAHHSSALCTLHSDRRLQEKRIFPAIDVGKSGTRKEELLLAQKELESVWCIRKALSNAPTAEVTETLINRLIATKTNEDFVESIKLILGR